MPQLVEVRFKGNRKAYFEWSDSEPLRMQEPVIVESDRGLDFGTVNATGKIAQQKCDRCAGCALNASKESGESARRAVEPTRKVVRRATSSDRKVMNDLRKAEDDVRRKVREKANAQGLPMKVSDTEWQWDRNKLTVYFTADKRVDFRNLVRELASQFRTRIDLRQIGVRDEAARLSGIGRCGRELCSASWLPELRPIGLHIAKDQRLSLNPSQISGPCGRLLCCLRYEHEFYVQSRKRFPKEGKILDTAKGKEKVYSIDIFRDRVTLRGEDGTSRIVELAELKGEMEAAASGAPVAVVAPPVPQPRPERRGGPTRPEGRARQEQVVNDSPAPAPAPMKTVAAPQAMAPAASLKQPATGNGTETADERLRRLSTPLVRKIAAEHHVEIANIPGSGHAGRVTKKDILGFIESGAPAAAAAPSAPASAPGSRWPEGAPTASNPAWEASPWEGDRVEPMSRIRQLTAEHMIFSRRTSAHVTSFYEVDMSAIQKLREKHKRMFEERGAKLTYLGFIVKAVADNLRKHPVVNAAVQGTSIIYRGQINIGIAVALDWGLIVPVIKKADELSLLGVVKTMHDLADRARAKKLKPDEVQNGTFTITNPGVFGSYIGAPIINQPQVAILGVGAIEKRPRVVTLPDGTDVIVPRMMTMLSMTYDHRIVDGADADRFFSDVKKMLESFPEAAV
ncbi:MAG: regulatory iron-sulfur-containing complex subunit RicT [Gemmatimonadales bacterium]